MAKQLLGKEVNAALNEKILADVDMLKHKNITPTLCLIRVGENEDDIAYERGTMKRCENLSVECKRIILPGNAEQEDVLAAVAEANNDESIHGILIFRPLPAHINEQAVIKALDPKKDVDGITDSSMVGVFVNAKQGYPPCTAQACIEILDHYNIDCTGKKVVVIGRSLVVGKPVAMMLISKNATVTVCHTKTIDMPALVREADIVVVAAGRAGIIDDSYFKAGQIVIDVGINFSDEGKLCGDVDFEKAEPIVEAITPVPGGVGAVTTSVLVGHVVDAAKKKIQ